MWKQLLVAACACALICAEARPKRHGDGSSNGSGESKANKSHNLERLCKMLKRETDAGSTMQKDKLILLFAACESLKALEHVDIDDILEQFDVLEQDLDHLGSNSHSGSEREDENKANEDPAPGSDGYDPPKEELTAVESDSLPQGDDDDAPSKEDIAKENDGIVDDGNTPSKEETVEEKNGQALGDESDVPSNEETDVNGDVSDALPKETTEEDDGAVSGDDSVALLKEEPATEFGSEALVDNDAPPKEEIADDGKEDSAEDDVAVQDSRPPCEGDDCPPQLCEGDDCKPPPCEGDDCPPVTCDGDDCQPLPCEGDDCSPPACEGDDCRPELCEGDDCQSPDLSKKQEIEPYSMDESGDGNASEKSSEEEMEPYSMNESGDLNAPEKSSEEVEPYSMNESDNLNAPEESFENNDGKEPLTKMLKHLFGICHELKLLPLDTTKRQDDGILTQITTELEGACTLLQTLIGNIEATTI
ncbi:unnamed protein product [Owenia fusiformis]|uniref:Uncharacterized protein n=1 Tax=Owenia fusiformis TaxID=6347 RepID=A0A8S4NBC2_OWEFU|nr:unnamed protein product [Owenia fusiformis]